MTPPFLFLCNTITLSKKPFSTPSSSPKTHQQSPFSCLKLELMKKEPETQKRQLNDGSDCANDKFQKRRKMGQEVSENDAKLNRFKIYKEVGSNKKRYYSGSRQTAGKVKYLDPTACSMKGFARKAKVTTTVIRKKPFKHTKLKSIKPTGSRSNERSFGSKDGWGQKPKVTTTVVSPQKPFKIVDSNLGKDKLVGYKSFENNEHKSITLAGLGSNKPSLGSRPADMATCSKDGYRQNPKVITTVISRKKPWMNVDDVGSIHRKMSSDGKGNLVEINKRLERFEPKELGKSRTFSGLRPAGKVKFWDPTCPREDDHVKKPEENATVVLEKEKAKREKIKIAIARFGQVYKELKEDNIKRQTVGKIAPLQLTVVAANKVKRELKWMDAEKISGPICGVQVGDRFEFRSQLQMVGLHCQLHRGIDYMEIAGKKLAISIVDSHRYSNASGYSDKLIYCGHGGTGLYGRKTPREDQKLKQGNLALKNSKDENTPVRVIRKVKGVGREEYVYDGLYMVKRYTKVRGVEGTLVFKFELERVPGQPSLHEMWRHH